MCAGVLTKLESPGPEFYSIADEIRQKLELNSDSFAKLISLSYEDLRDHTINIYYFKHIKNRSHAKKVSTKGHAKLWNLAKHH